MLAMLAMLGALAALAAACHPDATPPVTAAAPPDSTAPTIDYRVVRLTDSSIAIEGQARDDRGVSGVEWRAIASAGGIGPRDTTRGLAAPAGGRVVPFRVALPPQPVYRQVEVVLTARDSAGHATAGPSLRHAFGPLLQLTTVEPAGDTIWQRGLEVGVALTEGRTLTGVTVYVDSGTAAQRVLIHDPRFSALPPFSRIPVIVAAAGPHTITVVGSHQAGPPVSASIARTFLTPDVPYTLAALPDLGAGADALGISSRGDVAGWVATPEGRRRAAVWRGGQLAVLPLPDTTDVVARRVNAAGDVLVEFARRTLLSPYPETSVRVLRADGALLTVGPLIHPLAPPSPPFWACCDLATDLSDARLAVATVLYPFGAVTRSAILDVAAGTLDSVEFRVTTLNERGHMAGTVVGGYSNVGRYLQTVGFPTPAVQNPPGRPPCDLLAGRWTTTDPIDLDDGGNLLLRRCGTPLLVPAAGPPILLDLVLGDPIAVRLARTGALLVALDTSGTLLRWRVGERGPRRVAVPDGWRVETLGGVNGSGAIAASGRHVPSGRRAALRLTPAP